METGEMLAKIRRAELETSLLRNSVAVTGLLESAADESECDDLDCPCQDAVLHSDGRLSGERWSVYPIKDSLGGQLKAITESVLYRRLCVSNLPPEVISPELFDAEGNPLSTRRR